MENQPKYCGILLKDEIARLIVREKMIQGFDPEYLSPATNKLQPATYNMCLGSEYYYYKEGKVSLLSDSKPTLNIPPHDLVFVSSYETFKLPASVVARYDLRTKFLYQGLIIQTGTQIDPGYEGKIFSLLFNLSDKPVELIYGKAFSTMEFSYTTPQPDPPLVYDGPRQNMTSLEQVLPGGRELKSGLRKLAEDMGETRESVAETEKRVKKESRKMENVNMIFFMLIGLIIAAIAAILVPRAIAEVTPPPVNWPVVGMIVGAFVLVAGGLVWAIAWASTRRSKASDEKSSRREN